MNTSERPPQRRGGRTRGAEGYHKEDIEALLRCVRQVLPTSPDDWDQVLDTYRRTHAGPKTRAQRDTNSLKVKFKQLVRGFKPGESVRPELEEAGAIRYLMDAKMADGNWPQRRGGRARGAEGFSPADSQAILDVVRRLLPVQRPDWELVAEEYCRVYAVPNGRVSRDGTSLKSKFRNWIKDDGDAMPRAEVTEALTIQAEIAAKIQQLGRDIASREDVRGGECVSSSAEDREGSVAGTETLVTEAAITHETSTTSSKGGEKTLAIELRRGGRALGSEGYTQLDTKALLACVKEVLPSGPRSWDQVLQLYRVNHTTPQNRAPRNLTGIKSKFRQLVSWKQDGGKVAPEEVIEARAIQKEIDQGARLGKHPRSESGSNASFSYSPEESAPDSRDEHSLLLPHTESRNNENLERQNVVADAEWSVGPQVPVDVPVVKRQKQDSVNINVPKGHADSALRVKVPKGPADDVLRSEIVSRELELLRQREQREAEQAAWEKERALSEKQRLDMEAWTFVCDRLRSLYRERAAEKDPDIVSEIEEEVAVLKRKKQRLAGLMI